LKERKKKAKHLIYTELVTVKNQNQRLEKVAQRLRAMAALPKVLSSNPSNHMVAHNHL
jgi:ribosomal protein L14E/L6E/L27E